MNDKLKRYYQIINKINSGGDVTNDELEFFMATSPDIDESKIDDFLKNQKGATQEQFTAAIIEAARKVQSDPVYKDKLIKIATERQGKEISDKFATGVNLFLAGSDVANSIAQIKASNTALGKSKKPARPLVPQRDLLLQQAMRGAEEGTFSAGRALAPVQAQIFDQYQSDLANAKTASTGQAGAYGAYAQLAANRRNRAAMNLAPIQDDIKAREQARYDNLLGQRMNETQQMFQNQNSLYGNDLDQYNADQLAAGQLGATGRLNLRDSLSNFGGQVTQSAGDYYSQRKYRNLRNRATSAYNPELADKMVNIYKNLDGYTGNMTSDDTPEYWEQLY